jgi:hypothetical protein
MACYLFLLHVVGVALKEAMRVLECIGNVYISVQLSSITLFDGITLALFVDACPCWVWFHLPCDVWCAQPHLRARMEYVVRRMFVLFLQLQVHDAEVARPKLAAVRPTVVVAGGGDQTKVMPVIQYKGVFCVHTLNTLNEW